MSADDSISNLSTATILPRLWPSNSISRKRNIKAKLKDGTFAGREHF